VKHAEERSATDLRALRPEIFSNPAFAAIRAEFEAHGILDQSRPLSAPLSGEGLFVTEEHLNSYVVAAKSLFEGIVEFCDEHRDDRFPLGA
jgi:hypothetical protein